MMVKCVLAQCNEVDAFVHNLLENVRRKDTTAIDAAHNIQKLRKSYSKTDAEIARIYGKDQAWVMRMATLVNLSQELQKRVHDPGGGSRRRGGGGYPRRTAAHHPWSA
jgi:ParB/RepB/Spo0J family partition protein